MRDALRPETLADFSGQPKVSGHLEIIVGAAKNRKELCDHILFSGPPGVGKTTLANIIAQELGVNIVTTSGPAIEKPSDMTSLLTSVREPSVLFIDEIHRLPTQAEELLYPAMEDGVIDIVIGEGAKARSVRLNVAPIVVVGATTQAGLLTGPLRDRFGFHARLNLYEIEALTKVALRSADLLGMDLDGEAAALVASRSRGTPRIVNALLRRVRDYVEFNAIEKVNVARASEALETFGIDSLGLDDLSNEILRVLCTTFQGGPVGAGTLASAVGEASTTVVEVHEPYLMRCGFVARTPRGRVATAEAYKHLGLAVPAALAGNSTSDQQQLL